MVVGELIVLIVAGLVLYAALTSWGLLKTEGMGGRTPEFERGGIDEKWRKAPRSLAFVPMQAADEMKARQASRWTGRVGNGLTAQEWHDGRSLHTRRGDLVRSPAEVRIADHLFARGIRYEYEPMIQGYRPDFYLPDHGVVIEYWGMDARGSPHRRKKTAAYLRNGYSLVSLEPGKEVGLERDLDRQLWHKLRVNGDASA
jgi:hypothetical protein